MALWKVICPGKVHHFLWWLGHNSHPLHMNITRARGGVELDTRCAVCNRYFEDGGHLFFRSKLVKAVWRVIGLEKERVNLMGASSPLEVLEKIPALPNMSKLQVICLLWCWWTERNRIRHGERRMTPSEFAGQVTALTAEWLEFHATPARTSAVSLGKWKPPPQDWSMINFDASFTGIARISGRGCIARDATSDTLFTAAGNLMNLSTAMHAESVVLMKAINLAEGFCHGPCDIHD